MSKSRPDGQGVRRVGHGKDVAHECDVHHNRRARDHRGYENEMTRAIVSVRDLGQRDGDERGGGEQQDLDRRRETAPEPVEEEEDRGRQRDRAQQRRDAHAKRHAALRVATIQIELRREAGDEALMMAGDGETLRDVERHDAVALEIVELGRERADTIQARLRRVAIHRARLYASRFTPWRERSPR